MCENFDPFLTLMALPLLSKDSLKMVILFAFLGIIPCTSYRVKCEIIDYRLLLQADGIKEDIL